MRILCEPTLVLKWWWTKESHHDTPMKALEKKINLFTEQVWGVYVGKNIQDIPGEEHLCALYDQNTVIVQHYRPLENAEDLYLYTAMKMMRIVLTTQRM